MSKVFRETIPKYLHVARYPPKKNDCYVLYTHKLFYFIFSPPLPPPRTRLGMPNMGTDNDIYKTLPPPPKGRYSKCDLPCITYSGNIQEFL